MTPQDAAREISGELEAGERLLWSGIPRQGFFLRRRDGLLIPFSILWCGFAINWESTTLATRAPLFFKLSGLPFVLFGLYFVLGRFFVDVRQRGRTAYGLTDRRILIVGGAFSRSVKSLQLRTVSDVTLNERKDGSGTITLGPSPGSGSTSPEFDTIDDARNVCARVRAAQLADRGEH
jgi:PH (Pleckstrin Homology) domain-containing protein